MPNQADLPWVVLTLTGELDMSRTDDLDHMAAEALGGDRVQAVVDLEGVSFMDSSALRWLLNLQDRLDSASGRLRLAAPPGGSLERLLSLSGLEGRFAIFGTVAEATGSVDPPVHRFSIGSRSSDQPADRARKAV